MERQINFDLRFKDKELFSGRKNGVRARSVFDMNDVGGISKVVLSCSSKQVITSSYFLGLLELYVREFKSLVVALEHISLEKLSVYCRQECMDALEYSYLDDIQAF
jgi:hypothetical protein